MSQKICLGMFSAWNKGSSATAGSAGLPRFAGCSPIEEVFTYALYNSSCSSDCPHLEKCDVEKGVHRVLVLIQDFESCSNVINNKTGNKFILRV